MLKFFHGGKESVAGLAALPATVREVGGKRGRFLYPRVAPGIASALPRYCPRQAVAPVQPRRWGAGVSPPVSCSTRRLRE